MTHISVGFGRSSGYISPVTQVGHRVRPHRPRSTIMDRDTAKKMREKRICNEQMIVHAYTQQVAS